MNRVEHIGSATLYLGDCREIIPTLGLSDVTIVSDVPYGISYKHSGGGKGIHRQNGTRRQSREIFGDDSHFSPAHLLGFPCILFGADHFLNQLPVGGMLHVWDKDPKGRLSFDSFSDAELFWTSWTRSRVVCRYLWKGLCQEGQGERRWHPTAKPVEVMSFVVGMTQGTVCDPYMGSGTTGVASVRAGRSFIGIEIEPDYFEISCRRIAEEQMQPRFV